MRGEPAVCHHQGPIVMEVCQPMHRAGTERLSGGLLKGVGVLEEPVLFLEEVVLTGCEDG